MIRPVFSGLFAFILFFVTNPSHATSLVVKNFDSTLYRGEPIEKGHWAIEITPPKSHHFNLEAPRSAKAGSLSFDAVIETPPRIVFQVESSALKPGTEVETTAFLCDEGKTYCLKKKMVITLDGTHAKVIRKKFERPLTVQPKTIQSKPGRSKSAAKAVFLEDETAAVALATKTGKPLLIDFYGIWCPPCNLYNETVFNTKSFAAFASKFVFLKIDADSEKSYALKSKFKVGGYPTLVIAQADIHGSLTELERIVGYFPPKEFFKKLNFAYAHRADSGESRWRGRKIERLQALLEQKQFAGILESVKADASPSELLYRFIAEIKKNDRFLKDATQLESVKKTLNDLEKSAKSLDSTVILHTIDLLNDEFWLKQADYLKLTNALLDQLVSRVDSSTLYVRQSEMSLPDLDALRMSVYETLQDSAQVAQARKKAILDYEKLMALQARQGLRDLRGINLEYAALLTLDGRYGDARKIYLRSIEKYPEEFTFYFAAAKNFLLSKDLIQARQMAEKALQYSYGDNRIRAMDRWVTVMGELGLKKEATQRAEEFLRTIHIPEGLQVRTGRYIEALKKTLNKLNGDSK